AGTRAEGKQASRPRRACAAPPPAPRRRGGAGTGPARRRQRAAVDDRREAGDDAQQVEERRLVRAGEGQRGYREVRHVAEEEAGDGDGRRRRPPTPGGHLHDADVGGLEVHKGLCGTVPTCRLTRTTDLPRRSPLTFPGRPGAAPPGRSRGDVSFPAPG